MKNLKIEVLKIHKIQALPYEEPFWSVHVRVEDVFEVAFPIPYTVAQADIPAYIIQHAEDVFQHCKSIYAPKIADALNIVDMFLDLRKLKTK